VLYYLRPMPDLLAALRGSQLEPRGWPVPGVLVAAVVVVGLGLAPGLVWTLAHAA
jgi:hypothetical protein